MNLRTKYMGLELRSPIVVSACPLSEDVDNIRRMEDEGAGAVVLFSLFEEQLRGQQAKAGFTETEGLFPALEDYHTSAGEYLKLIREAKERVNIPIIASLNGVTDEGWVNYAREIEQAGADGLEINVFYLPSDINVSGRDVEAVYVDIVDKVKATVSIPIAIKINPYFSSIGHMAKQLQDAGADALVLFNRFYQPDFDIGKLQVKPSLEYSHSGEIRLPLLWIATLYDRIGTSLAATTGVQGARELIKYLLAGADVVMTASALYKYGIPYLRQMTKELEGWMKELQFYSIVEFKGLLSQEHISDTTAYQRANYIRILEAAK